MYVPMGEILNQANKGNYAVLAVNCFNLEMARAAVKAAEEEYSPLIINIGQGQMTKHADGELMTLIIQRMSEKSNVPIALNLDHGRDFEKIISVIRYGFSSIMIDASKYDLEDNIKRTKEVVKMAKPLNISVEAELGHVGQGMDYHDYENNIESLFTDPEEAKHFLEETGVDALAVAVGTAHGDYHGIPKIDFERLKKLKSILGIPLVLHGGSGSGEENMVKAIECGINKINICTDVANTFKNAFIDEIKKDKSIDTLNLLSVVENQTKEKIRYYIRLFGSNNKAR